MSCGACGTNTGVVDCLLAPTAVYLTIPLCRRMRLLGGGCHTILVNVLSNILTDLYSMLLLTLIFRFSRTTCIAFLPGSVAATVNVNISRRLNNRISMAIIIVVVANIVNGVFTRGFLGLLYVGRPVTGNVTVNYSTRTLNATGTVRVNAVRNTVDDLSVIIYNIVAMVNSSVFTVFV